MNVFVKKGCFDSNRHFNMHMYFTSYGKSYKIIIKEKKGVKG